MEVKCSIPSIRGIDFISGNISDIVCKQVIEFTLESLIIHSQHKIIYINYAGGIIRASPFDIFKLHPSLQ